MWIQTYTGKQFYPLTPRIEDIDIRDIAHSLSLKCRYTGHTKRLYSVGQHSVIASLNWPSDPQWALMHDAAEAYLPDVARPIKNNLFLYDGQQAQPVSFHVAEMRILRLIADKYDLSMPFNVKLIDNIMLVTERRDVMTPTDYKWEWAEGLQPLEEKIVPWQPEHTEKSFLYRFYELFPNHREETGIEA